MALINETIDQTILSVGENGTVLLYCLDIIPTLLSFVKCFFDFYNSSEESAFSSLSTGSSSGSSWVSSSVVSSVVSTYSP